MFKIIENKPYKKQIIIFFVVILYSYNIYSIYLTTQSDNKLQEYERLTILYEQFFDHLDRTILESYFDDMSYKISLLHNETSRDRFFGLTDGYSHVSRLALFVEYIHSINLTQRTTIKHAEHFSQEFEYYRHNAFEMLRSSSNSSEMNKIWIFESEVDEQIHEHEYLIRKLNIQTYVNIRDIHQNNVKRSVCGTISSILASVIIIADKYIFRYA